MPIGLAFWVLMLLWLVGGFFFHREDFNSGKYGPVGAHLLVFVLIFLIGWKVFGAPLQ